MASAAQLKALRRKYGLGEFAKKKSRATTRKGKRPVNPFAPLPPAIYTGPRDPYPPQGVHGGYWNSPAQHFDEQAAKIRDAMRLDLIEGAQQ